MANIRKIRKTGIWVIAALTLLVLLTLSIMQEQSRAGIVAFWAALMLTMWLIAMAAWQYINARKRKDNC